MGNTRLTLLETNIRLFRCDSDKEKAYRAFMNDSISESFIQRKHV